jgi:hypothetical protein
MAAGALLTLSDPFSDRARHREIHEGVLQAFGREVPQPIRLAVSL